MKITSLAELKNLIAAGNCPAGLTLALWGNNLTETGAKALAGAIASGNCPAGLTLALWGNNLTETGAKALAGAIASGNCPAGLTLHLWGNNLTDAAAQALATALQSDNCPAGLTLNLKYNRITDTGAQTLAQAIAHPNAPDNLTIKLNSTLITEPFHPNKPYWQSALRTYQKNQKLKREYARILPDLVSGLTGPGKKCHLSKIAGTSTVLSLLTEYLLPTADSSDSQKQTAVLENKMTTLTRKKIIKSLTARWTSLFYQSQPSMPQDLTPLDLAHNPYAMIIHSGK